MAKTRRAPDEEDVRRRRPDDEDDDAPRRARKRSDEDETETDDEPFKPRKRRKSAAGPVKLIIRICFGIVLAAAIIILLLWIYTPVGTDASLACYFPPETTQLAGYDVDEGFRNHKLKPVHETMLNNYRTTGERRFPAATGVTVNEVSKYMSGVASSKTPDEDSLLPPQERRGAITVIRFKQSVDQTKFINAYTGNMKVEERTSKDGRKYQHLYSLEWRKDHYERNDDVSFFFPNSRTLVYATTWRELEECMNRQPGRVVLEGDMRELANKVDGHYFQASTGWYELNGVSNTMAFGLGFVDQDVREQKDFVGRTGTASWFASNGNDFLYASAALYTDTKTAREVRRKLRDSFEKAQIDFWQSDSGKPSGLENPFQQRQEQKGPFGGGGGTNEQDKDVIEALVEFAATARVYTRGRLVVVEGEIPHGTEEQGIFELFWRAVSSKFSYNQYGFNPGMMGMPGGGPVGGPPGGMPMPGGSRPP